MNPTVYWASGSPYSWRVLLGLALEQVPYHSHRLDVGAKEPKGEAFLAINPKGTFPVLVDGEFTLTESLAILVYLDEHSGDHRLFGATPAQKARTWEAIFDHEGGLGPQVQTVTRAVFRKAGDLEAAKPVVGQALASLDELDARLEGRDFVGGEAPSAADLVYYPTVHRLLRAATKDRAAGAGLESGFLAERPRVEAWLARLGALPGVDDTYPPHWR